MNPNDQIATTKGPDALAPRTFKGVVLVQEAPTGGAQRGEVHEGQANLALDLQRLTLTSTTPVDQLQRRWSFSQIVDLVQEGKSVRFTVVPPPKREPSAPTAGQTQTDGNLPQQAAMPTSSSGPVLCTFTMEDEVSAEDLAEELAKRRDMELAPLNWDIAVFARRLFAANRRAYLTIVLIAANVAVFIAMVLCGVSPFFPSGKELIRWGANAGILTTSGEWWRTLTYCFVHIGILHLAFNMYALKGTGQLVERLLGSWFYLAVYVASGLGGSLVSIWWNPEVLSAGASGAIFGVYGALLGYLGRQRGTIPTSVLENLWQSTLVFVGYNIFLGFRGRIDQAAHIGGLVTGIVSGYAAARPLLLGQRKRATTSSAFQLALSVIFVLGLGFAAVPHLGQFGLVRNLAEKGEPRAEYLLAHAYEEGVQVAKDENQAVEWFERSAQHGFAPAQFVMGVRYDTGTGVVQDDKKSAAWFRQAAEQGLPEAQFNLAIMYDLGQGVPANDLQAMAWERKAAEQGFAQAQLALGHRMLMGNGVEKDLVTAAQWVHKAADQGNGLAQCLLGQMYSKGEGVPKSLNEAADWFRKCGDQTNAFVLNAAAWFLATCPDAGLRDGAAAVGLAERAVAATDRKEPNYLDTLAAAYAEVGQFEEAVALQKEAVSRTTQVRKDAFASRLKLYEAGRPYHEEDPGTRSGSQ